MKANVKASLARRGTTTNTSSRKINISNKTSKKQRQKSTLASSQVQLGNNKPMVGAYSVENPLRPDNRIADQSMQSFL